MVGNNLDGSVTASMRVEDWLYLATAIRDQLASMHLGYAQATQAVALNVDYVAAASLARSLEHVNEPDAAYA